MSSQTEERKQISARANQAIQDFDKAIADYGEAVRAHERAVALVSKLMTDLDAAKDDRGRKLIAIDIKTRAIAEAARAKEDAIAARAAAEAKEAAEMKAKGES